MLRPGDGLNGQRADLKYEVKHLQRMLIKIGFDLTASGAFDHATETSIRKFQRDHQLSVDGVIGNFTWEKLESAFLSSKENQDTPRVENAAQANRSELDTSEQLSESKPSTLLPDFRGDLAWIHKQEGHAFKPYWPGGHSGVTLDPGFDLGQNLFSTLAEYYAQILSNSQQESLREGIGKTGRGAKRWLNRNRDVLAIRIRRQQAETVFPFLAAPYWNSICQRVPQLAKHSTPASVQTALLSIAYNRGAANKDLEKLIEPILNEDWLDCARLIGGMQHDHRLSGIRSRRKREAELIFSNPI